MTKHITKGQVFVWRNLQKKVANIEKQLLGTLNILVVILRPVKIVIQDLHLGQQLVKIMQTLEQRIGGHGKVQTFRQDFIGEISTVTNVNLIVPDVCFEFKHSNHQKIFLKNRRWIFLK